VRMRWGMVRLLCAGVDLPVAYRSDSGRRCPSAKSQPLHVIASEAKQSRTGLRHPVEIALLPRSSMPLDPTPYNASNISANSTPHSSDSATYAADTATDLGLSASEDAGRANGWILLLAINPFPYPFRRDSKAVLGVKCNYKQHFVLYKVPFERLIKLLRRVFRRQ
jgi:hypothetical protein